ncbi:MAG: hypothetical protein WD533_07775 [Dehalococcoidia bacterium]
MRAVSWLGVSVVLGSLLIVNAAGGDVTPVEAVHSAQEPPLQGAELGLEFSMGYPAGWSVEITSPGEAAVSLDEDAGIFVSTLAEVSPGVPLDALLALTAHELQNEFARFQQAERESELGGELNGWPATDMYFEGTIDDEGAQMDVEGQLLLVAGEDSVFMLMALSSAADAGLWREAIDESIQTFQPVPGPLVSLGQLGVGDTLLASEVGDCETFTASDDSTFAPGERMYVLADVQGAEAVQTGEEERVVLSVPSLVLRDAQGEVFSELQDLGAVELTLEADTQSVCVWVWVDIAVDAPAGPAVAEVALRDDTSGETATLFVPLAIVQEREQPEDAQEVTVGEEFDGALGPEETHEYAVELEEGVTYVFEVRLDTLGDSVLTLLDASGEQVAFDDDSGPGLGSRIVWTAEESGEYYVLVEAYGADEGAYVLEAAEWEEFTADAEPLAIGEAASGEVDASSTSLYAAELEEGATYIFDVELGTLEDSVLVLLGPAGEELVRNDDFGGTLASQIIWTVGETGTYFVEVQAYGDNAGSYELSAAESELSPF